MSLAQKRRVRRRQRCSACPHRRHVGRCAQATASLVTPVAVYAACCGCSGPPRAPVVVDGAF